VYSTHQNPKFHLDGTLVTIFRYLKKVETRSFPHLFSSSLTFTCLRSYLLQFIEGDGVIFLIWRSLVLCVPLSYSWFPLGHVCLVENRQKSEIFLGNLDAHGVFAEKSPDNFASFPLCFPLKTRGGPIFPRETWQQSVFSRPISQPNRPLS